MGLTMTGPGNARTGGIGSGQRKWESCLSIMQLRPSGAGVPEECSLGQNCRYEGGCDFNGDRPGAKGRAGMEWTHLTRACRAATGRRGVTDSFERRSLSEEAERVRLELERSERSIMAAGVVGRNRRGEVVVGLKEDFPPTRVSGGCGYRFGARREVAINMFHQREFCKVLS